MAYQATRYKLLHVSSPSLRLYVRFIFKVVEMVFIEKDNCIEALTSELNDIVHQLIEAKMANATCSFELDEARKKCGHLKRRVQVLGERVAVLEVAAAEALEAKGVASNEDEVSETV